MSSFKSSLFAAAFLLPVASSAFAAPPSTPILLQTAGIYEPATIAITGPLNESVYATAVEFGALSGAATLPQTLYGFCVDLFHPVPAGLDASHDIVTGAGDAQATVNLAYHTGALTVDSSSGPSGAGGVALTTAQIGEIGSLAGYGRRLIQTDAADLSNKLAGVQGAIWSIEYPSSEGYTFTAPAPVQAYIDSYVSNASKTAVSPGRVVQAIYANDGASQAFVIGVPEPATWAMLLVGFGAVGVAMRRRKLVAA